MKKTITIIIFIAISAIAEKPLMKNFIGINGHFHFKPELYGKVCKQARNYHNINWDVKKIGDPTTYPMAANGVNWESHLYKPWKEAGFEVDICVQFGTFSARNKNYKDIWGEKTQAIYDYGYSIASFFGPSGIGKYCTSIEIGNEPGNIFDDTLYQEIFINMAKGIRAADPKIKIVTCTAHTKTSGEYSKNLQETFSSSQIKNLYDVINIHAYAVKPKSQDYSPWDRSYPEDPSIKYLKEIDEVIEWKNQNAKDKEIWVTEFGWDSVTPDAMNKRTGWAKKLNWQGVTDLQQAQYIVRSFFCFAERDIQKAYLFFYDDQNEPSVHAAAGITRNFQPKTSYWAMKQLYETLGEFRLNKVIRQDDEAYIYEFTSPYKLQEVIWVAWSPTGSDKTKEIIIPKIKGRLMKTEPMQTSENPDSNPPVKLLFQKDGSLKLTITESPTYLHFVNK